MPICHRDGQMVRTMNDELCEKESPRRCHECFPDITPQDLLHAQALHPVPPRAGRPLHRAERVRARPLRRLGASRRARSTVAAVAWCRSPTGVPDEPGAAAAQPLRVLRPAQSLQGRRRAAGGDGPARRRLRRPPLDLRREPRQAERRSSASGSRSCSRRDRDDRHVRRAATSASRPRPADGTGSTGWWCPRSGGRPGRSS